LPRDILKEFFYCGFLSQYVRIEREREKLGWIKWQSVAVRARRDDVDISRAPEYIYQPPPAFASCSSFAPRFMAILCHTPNSTTSLQR